MKIIVALLASLILWTTPLLAQQWYKGNLHVHTVNSDGNTSPDIVARWYKENGYHFVFITDHDMRTPVAGLNAIYAAPDQFAVFPGVEVTDRFENQPVHLIGLGVKDAVGPSGGTSVEEIIDADARSIARAGGVPFVAHPNGLLPRALTAAEIASSDRVRLFEMCCSDYRGGSGFPSTEELWDQILTSGERIYGAAADDAHDFDPSGKDPGKAWVMVKSAMLSCDGILSAIEAGDFFGYRTYFIGAGGDQLQMNESHTPCQELTGESPYVRARIERSDGAFAWVQPIFADQNP